MRNTQHPGPGPVSLKTHFAFLVRTDNFIRREAYSKLSKNLYLRISKRLAIKINLGCYVLSKTGGIRIIQQHDLEALLYFFEIETSRSCPCHGQHLETVVHANMLYSLPVSYCVMLQGVTVTILKEG